MVSESSLIVGNTGLDINLIDKPIFMDMNINSFEDSLAYSEDTLQDAYSHEIQRICELFNKALLPIVVKHVFNTVKTYKIKNKELFYKLESCIERNDYSDFYIHSNAFIIGYVKASQQMGCFSAANVRVLNFDNVYDMPSLISTLQSRLPMKVNVNIHYLRGHFFDSMYDTLRHEMAHAFVYIYFKGLLKAISGFDFNIKPHGSEWKQIAYSLGATPRATNKLEEKERSEVVKSMTYYSEKSEKPKDKKFKVKKKRRFHYQCGCNIDHTVTKQKHDKMQSGIAGYRCKKCKKSLSFSGKESYIY